MTPDQALRTAYDQRADLRSAKAAVNAAEEAVKAARGERYPNVGVTADYGDVGPTLNSSHGTFSFPGRGQIQHISTAAVSRATSIQATRGIEAASR